MQLEVALVPKNDILLLCYNRENAVYVMAADVTPAVQQSFQPTTKPKHPLPDGLLFNVSAVVTKHVKAPKHLLYFLMLLLHQNVPEVLLTPI